MHRNVHGVARCRPVPLICGLNFIGGFPFRADSEHAGLKEVDSASWKKIRVWVQPRWLWLSLLSAMAKTHANRIVLPPGISNTTVCWYRTCRLSSSTWSPALLWWIQPASWGQYPSIPALEAFQLQEEEVSPDLVLSRAAVAARGWGGHQEQPVDQNAPEADGVMFPMM